MVLCRRFSQLMGGDVTVESEFGKGTTFTLTLPTVVSE
ncbi:MAG: ATP-binding protein [Limisphaerales bacterium]